MKDIADPGYLKDMEIVLHFYYFSGPVLGKLGVEAVNLERWESIVELSF